MALYQWEDPYPSIRHVPTHVTTFDIDDGTPTEGNIEEAVRSLKMNIVGGNTHMRAEHLHTWIRSPKLIGLFILV